VKVGILGGSFDPVHLGHVHAASEVRARAGLDRVELVVAAEPPHKPACSAPFADRVAMARLAVKGRPELGVLDLEGRRAGPSYTFYTVTELSSERPGDDLALLVGADMLADLPSWHRAAELVAAVAVIAFARPGFGFEEPQKAFLGAFPGARLTTVEVAPREVSSTEIRRRVAAGDPAPELLDPAVAGYIFERGLYRDQIGVDPA
jgi:nicotinate-nucleotide adenylyltransferase